MTATPVVLVAEPNYMHKTKLVSVGLMAEVKSLSGSVESTATGTVTFEMVMPAGMKMKGMKRGTTIFGTMPVSDGMAMLTLPARKVLNMPLTIVYSGDSQLMSSTDTPAMLTKAGLKGMGSGMKM